MMEPLNSNNFPQHVAIIMDGNGRWAKQHNLPRLEGHERGAACTERVVEDFIQYEIPYLTIYAFSTENWNRPRLEVAGLFRLLGESLDRGIRVAQEKGIRVHHLGKLDGLPGKIQTKIKQVLELTKGNTQLNLCLAFNYGSRSEIVEAIQRIILDDVPVQDINESIVSQHLHTAGIPDPDLIIRTGGEMRLSNFLLWQAAYAEIYFSTLLWPDFSKKEIDKALIAYSKRQRRFGSV